MLDKKTQGKKNREAGGRFELKVRKDLEKKGWIVDKWSNNVEFGHTANIDGSFTPVAWKDLTLKNGDHYPGPGGRLIPAKRKFNPFMKALGIGTGFPDFIAFRNVTDMRAPLKHVIAVESKVNGKLDKIEKEKCQWLLDNNIFSKILIARKGEKRGEIFYDEFAKV